jgi:hypothetical protein
VFYLDDDEVGLVAEKMEHANIRNREMGETAVYEGGYFAVVIEALDVLL